MSESLTLDAPSTPAAPVSPTLNVKKLREELAKLAKFRTAMNKAYRLNHSNPEHSWAVKAALAEWNPTGVYCWFPGRLYLRDYTTDLHVLLAHSRGKVHVKNRPHMMAESVRAKFTDG